MFLPADLKEKFHNKITIVSQLSLEALHAFNFLLVLLLSYLVVQYVLYYLIHPARIKKLKLPLCRNLYKIPI